MKLRDLGEFGLIDRIAGQVRNGKGVTIGIGDDAAATSPTPGCVTLITSDMLVEGVHFDLSWSDPFTLGRKSLAVNLSDLAAMGAVPRSFLLSLAIPESIPVEFLDLFVQGLLVQAKQFQVALVGGDTCASRSGLVISITALGEQRPELVVKRSGARPGDLIFVTGFLGDSAHGLELLLKGERQGGAVQSHLDPIPRVREGVALAEAGIASAMIDVSDGLLADLGHIVDQSGVGACLKLARIPLSQEWVGQPGADPYRFALCGGEDYELLFTAPAAKSGMVTDLFASLGTSVATIGEITDCGTLKVIAPDGSDYPVEGKGYNHFSTATSMCA